MAPNVWLTSFLQPSRRDCRVCFRVLKLLVASLCVGGTILPLRAQNEPATQPPAKFQGETTQDYNERLEQMAGDIVRARPDVIVTGSGLAVLPPSQPH